MSEKYQKFLKILEDGTKNTCGHYQFLLPFTNAILWNFEIANARLSSFKVYGRRFNKDQHFKDEYVRFMNKIILKCCAKKSIKEPVTMGRVGTYHIMLFITQTK